MKFLHDISTILLIVIGALAVLLIGFLVSIDREHKKENKKNI